MGELAVELRIRLGEAGVIGQMPYFYTLLENTLMLGLYQLLFGFPAPIVLALMLNEVRIRWFKRTVQTVSFLPHFVSSVVIIALFANALRSLSPWLKKMPSRYIREHCHFTTQPIEEPDNPRDLMAIFNMIDAENILLFSSDYPHWDFDDPMEILRLMSPEGKRKIVYENAKNLYRL